MSLRWPLKFGAQVTCLSSLVWDGGTVITEPERTASEENWPTAVDSRTEGSFDIVNVSENCTEGWRNADYDAEEALWQCCRRDYFFCWDTYHTFRRCCTPKNQSDRLANVKNVHFVTFGTRHYFRRAQVLADRAVQTGWFKTSRAFSLADLDVSFVQRHRNFIARNPRLGGYGIWKPQLLLQALRDIEDGDVLLYTDAGCEFDVQAAWRFEDYVRAAEQSTSGLFTFTFAHGTQRWWTKPDTVDALSNLGFDVSHMDEVQHISGIIFTRKSPIATSFLKDWWHIMQLGYRLIDDSPPTRNDSSYIEGRHDQAMFSMLLYNRDHSYHIRDETIPLDSVGNPIKAARACGPSQFKAVSKEEWERNGCSQPPGPLPRNRESAA